MRTDYHYPRVTPVPRTTRPVRQYPCLSAEERKAARLRAFGLACEVAR